jgi:hypothetical protein
MKTKILILVSLFASQIAWAGCTSRIATAVEGDEVVSTNTVVVCSDGEQPKLRPNVKIGDRVFENELPKLSNQKNEYFTYYRSQCRLFREKYMLNEKFQLAYGVICHLDERSEFWQVVDKW